MEDMPGKGTRAGTWPRVAVLVGVTVLVWIIARVYDRADVVRGPVIVEPVTTAPAHGPLRDVGTIVGLPDPLPLVGRVIEVTDVPVWSVPGDRTLWVGWRSDRVLFVAVSREMESDRVDPGATTEEGRLGARAGQRVTFSGVLRAVPADLEAWRTRWGLDGPEAEAVRRRRVYVVVERAKLHLR